jgi:hypothetical protein
MFNGIKEDAAKPNHEHHMKKDESHIPGIKAKENSDQKIYRQDTFQDGGC